MADRSPVVMPLEYQGQEGGFAPAVGFELLQELVDAFAVGVQQDGLGQVADGVAGPNHPVEAVEVFVGTGGGSGAEQRFERTDARVAQGFDTEGRVGGGADAPEWREADFPARHPCGVEASSLAAVLQAAVGFEDLFGFGFDFPGEAVARGGGRAAGGEEGAVSVSSHSGGQRTSSSVVTMTSPRADRMPVLRAWARPAIGSWTQTTAGYCAARVEVRPDWGWLSTTTISNGREMRCAERASRQRVRGVGAVVGGDDDGNRGSFLRSRRMTHQ